MVTNHHNHSVEKSFRILKQDDDKFFSRLMSKETSMANSSSRVFYYGESSVAVPFVWEQQPGTPKHPLCEASLPPLTPPPSYHTNSKSKIKRRGSKLANSVAMFSCILPRFARAHVSSSPSSSWSSSLSSSSSSSSSAWSLVYPSSSCPVRDKDQGSLVSFDNHKAPNIGFRGCYNFGSMKKKNANLRHEGL